jgi:hypothetical protein
MIGSRDPQKQLWSYHINLDKRVRSDHPLRKLNQALKLDFVHAPRVRDGACLQQIPPKLVGERCRQLYHALLLRSQSSAFALLPATNRLFVESMAAQKFRVIFTQSAWNDLEEIVDYFERQIGLPL